MCNLCVRQIFTFGFLSVISWMHKKVNRGTLDYATCEETEGVIGDSNAWVNERGQEYVRRLVGPRRRVYVGPTLRTTR